jgi:hypothetical protein
LGNDKIYFEIFNIIKGCSGLDLGAFTLE